MNADIHVFGKEDSVKETYQGFLSRSIPARRRHGLRSRPLSTKKKDTPKRVFLLVLYAHYGPITKSGNKITAQRSGCDFERRKTFAVGMDAPARSSDIQRSFLSGGDWRTRTVDLLRVKQAL